MTELIALYRQINIPEVAVYFILSARGITSDNSWLLYQSNCYQSRHLVFINLT